MLPIEAIRDPKAIASSKEAAEFLGSFPWCGKINRGYLACWCSGVFGVFQFDVTPTKISVNNTVWIVVNSTPRACCLCDDAEDWQDALRDFISEMRRWIKSDPRNVDTATLKKYLQNLEDDWANAAPERLCQDTFW
jgi:hypothetical protein